MAGFKLFNSTIFCILWIYLIICSTGVYQGNTAPTLMKSPAVIIQRNRTYSIYAVSSQSAIDDGVVMCLPPWVQVHRSCVRFIKDVPLTWHDARKDCKRQGADLMSINDRNELEKLRPELKNQITRQALNWWVGLRWVNGFNTTDGSRTNITEWLWVDNAEFIPRLAGRANGHWPFGSPPKECFQLNKPFQWNNVACTENKSYICEMVKATPHPTKAHVTTTLNPDTTTSTIPTTRRSTSTENPEKTTTEKTKQADAENDAYTNKPTEAMNDSDTEQLTDAKDYTHIKIPTVAAMDTRNTKQTDAITDTNTEIPTVAAMDTRNTKQTDATTDTNTEIPTVAAMDTRNTKQTDATTDTNTEIPTVAAMDTRNTKQTDATTDTNTEIPTVAAMDTRNTKQTAATTDTNTEIPTVAAMDTRYTKQTNAPTDTNTEIPTVAAKDTRNTKQTDATTDTNTEIPTVAAMDTHDTKQTDATTDTIKKKATESTPTPRTTISIEETYATISKTNKVAMDVFLGCYAVHYESSCPPVEAFGISWPRTEPGNMATVECENGQANWTCDKNTTCWKGEPDVKQCTSDNIQELTKQKDGLLKMKSVTSDQAVAFTESLASVVGSETALSEQDIFQSTKLMNSAAKSNPKTAFAAKSILKNVLKCGNSLVSKKRQATWSGMNTAFKRAVASSLIDSMESVSKQMIKAFDEPTVENIKEENMAIELHVINVDNLDPLGKDVVYQGESNTFAISPANLRAFSSGGLARLVFLNYNNVAELLQPDVDKDDTSERRIISQVLSASFGEESMNIVLPEPVLYTFKTETRDGNNAHWEQLCSFWNFSLGYSGAWSQEGCSLQTYNTSHTTCQCNHLTNFAILMDIHKTPGCYAVHYESSCPPVEAFGISWPKTEPGNMATVECENGQANWTCDKNTNCWKGEPDVKQCTSDNIQKLTKQKDGLLKMKSETSEQAVAFTASLASAVGAESVLSEQDIFQSTKLMNAAAKSKPKTALAAKSILKNVLKCGNSLVSKKRQATWSGMNTANKRAVASSLIDSMESVSKQMLKAFDEPTVENIKEENMAIELHVINVDNLDPLGKDVVYQGETNTFSISPANLRAFSSGGLARLVFLNYNNVAELLQPDVDKDDTSERRIISQVLSASFGEESMNIVLPEPVLYTFKTETRDGNNAHWEQLCSFWNFSLGYSGAWSQEGCSLQTYNTSHTTCQCNHLTNFAILMDIHKTPGCYAVHYESSCPPVEAFGISWPKTEPGNMATVECENGQANWTCDKNTNCWKGEPDVKQCTSDNIQELTKQKDGLLKMKSETSDQAVAFTESLASAVGAESVLSEQDIFQFTKLMNAAAKSKPKTAFAAKSILKNVLKCGNSLVSKKRQATWSGMNTANKRAVASSLIDSMESVSKEMLKAFTEPTVENIKEENMAIELHVINVNNLDPLGKDVVYQGESNTFAISPANLRAFSSGGLARLVFINYNNVAELLQPDVDKDDTSERRIISQVLSASFGEECMNTVLLEPVLYTFKTETRDGNNAHWEQLCSFWNFSLGYSGAWSQEGCSLQTYNTSHTTCQCNHLTNFAILMDIHKTPLSAIHTAALSYITYVGIIISIICLFLSWLSFTCLSMKCMRSSRHNQTRGNAGYDLCESGKSQSSYHSRTVQGERNSIHKHLVFCLLIAEVLFLSGIERTTQKIACAIIAGCLHFFFLASFTWMFIEGVHILFMVVQVFESAKSRMKQYYLIGYGSPMITVVISALVYHEGYGTEQYCWLSTERMFLWSFAGPVAFILLVNLMILIYAMSAVCKHSEYVFSKEKAIGGNLKAWIQGALTLEVLLGLTWVFGYFYISEEAIPMAYLFTIFNSLQGLFIFLFHCILNKKVRKEYQHFISYKHWMSTGTHTTSRSANGSELGPQKGPFVRNGSRNKSNTIDYIDITKERNEFTTFTSGPQNETFAMIGSREQSKSTDSIDIPEKRNSFTTFESGRKNETFEMTGSRKQSNSTDSDDIPEETNDNTTFVSGSQSGTSDTIGSRNVCRSTDLMGLNKERRGSITSASEQQSESNSWL